MSKYQQIVDFQHASGEADEIRDRMANGTAKRRRSRIKRCKGCNYPIAPDGGDWCAECLCEDDCAP